MACEGRVDEIEATELVTALFDRWHMQLVLYAFRSVNNHDLAQDLVHDAFLQLPGKDEGDAAQAETAKYQFFRRKAGIDATWIKKLRQSTSLLSVGGSPRSGDVVSVSFTVVEHGTILSSK